MKIDAHQHFWLHTPEEFGWITDDMAAIRRNFLPHDLLPELQEAGIDGCVAVQAAQSPDENHFLLGLAEEYGFIRGVVGWVDLQAGDVSDTLANLVSAYPKLVGVRHVVQSEPDPDFLLRPAFMNGIRQLEKHRLTYDILIRHPQLPAAVQFAGQLPNQPFVLDHLAKPDIKTGAGFGIWKDTISQLAAHPNVCAKLSGMVTEADWQHWQPGDFGRYLDAMLEAFTPHRLMFGSDWPVCLVASPYQQTVSLVTDYIARLTENERAMVMGGNAQAFYRLR